MHMASKNDLRSLLIVFTIVASTLWADMSKSQDSTGSDDGCSSFCFVVLQLAILEYVVAANLRTEFQLTQIGNSLSTLGATNTAGLSAIQATNSEGFRNVINEAHTLEEKVQTLNVKNQIERTFGSVSQDVCFQVDTIRGGAIDQVADDRRRSSESVQAFDQSLVATGSARIKEWKEVDASPEILAQIFDGLDDLSDNNYSRIVRLVTEHRRYPYPANRGSNNALAYKQLYRERNEHLKIARAAIMDHLAANSFPLTEQSAAFSNAVLGDAGAIGGTTKRDLVKAIGLSTFGNESSIRISSMQGEELLRVLGNEVAKSQYLASENNRLFSQVAEFKGLSAALEIENHYQGEMINSLDQLN